MNRSHRTAILVISCLFVGIGIGLIVQTARLGGGLGYAIGVLFIVLGIGRFYIQRKRGRSQS